MRCCSPTLSHNYSWWSSAYMKRFVSLTNMVMSFWNKFHNNGPNEDPWGQPRDILDHSLLIVPSFTRLYLSFRNDRIRSNDWLVNPYALSFLMTKLWHRESKALLMSVDRMVTNSFLSIACKRKELVEKVRFCIPLRQIYFHSFIMIISIIILISNFHPRAPHCTTMHGNTEGQANITIGY